MSATALMLRRFGPRLKQMHLSEVNSRSSHDPISFAAFSAFRRVAPLIPPEVPVILETIVPEGQINQQIALAWAALSGLPVRGQAVSVVFSGGRGNA